MVVLGRLQDFDFSVIEAAQDLGAGWWTAARRVLLPLLAPGIAAGALLAFTLSIDDFVITFFVAGPGSTTLPIRIYSMIKHGSPPLINALSTILLVITFVDGLAQPAPNEGEDMTAADRVLAAGGALRRSWPRSPAAAGTPRSRPARLHLGRLHQARAGHALREGERLPGRHRHLRLQRGHVRQAQGRAPSGYDLITPSSYMVSDHARPGACCSRSTTRCCRTSRTSTRST